MKNLKKEIKTRLSNSNLEGIENLIHTYQENAPNDLELVSIKVFYFILTNNYDEALLWAKYGYRRNPYNVEVNYNLAYMHELVGEYFDAYKYYSRTLTLAIHEENEDIIKLNIEEKLDNIIRNVTEVVENEKDTAKLNDFLEKIKELSEDKYCFGLTGNPFHAYDKTIGGIYKDYIGNKAYVGYYKRAINYFPEPDNTVQSKSEIRKIYSQENNFKIEGNTEQILPILSEEENVIRFKE